MKTAISLSDRLFEEAEKAAQRLGVPRSQLFVRAMEEFLEKQNHQTITDRLNAVYSSGQPGPSDAASGAGLDALRSLTEHDSW